MIQRVSSLVVIFTSMYVFCFGGPEGVTQRSPKKLYTLDYVKPEQFLADFTNLSCHRDKPIRYWATQLLLFFAQNKKLNDFSRELARAVSLRDPNRIGNVFLTYQNCFAPDFKGLIMKDLRKIWSALEVRCQCPPGKKCD